MANDPHQPIGQPEYQPLYLQVTNLLVQRIGSGAWKPGDMLPNEFELAAEYRVSQGTMRKALNALEAERMIVRRQGVGTFVARHSSEQALFQFFRLFDLDDRRLTPTSQVLEHTLISADADQARRLGRDVGTRLHAITRIRTLLDRPAIFEQILLAEQLMPDLMVEIGRQMDEEMYVIYQSRFGISIARASERLAAVAAGKREADLLNIRPGTPLLEITRVAYDVTGQPVELRISRCLTDAIRYAADVQ